MAILRSPGCTCCDTGCDVVAYQDLNHQLQAGTAYQLPGNVNTFTRLELSNLIPDGYFKTQDDWIEIASYTTGGSLISGIRFQLMSLGHSYMYHAIDSSLPYPTIDKWRGLGARFGNDWFLVRPTLHTKNVGSKELCITDVSDGTFNGEVCVVSSIKRSYTYAFERTNPTATSPTYRWEDKITPCRIEEGYAFSKNRYELFDNETTFSTQFHRFNNSTTNISASIEYSIPNLTIANDSVSILKDNQTYSISKSLSGVTTGTGSIQAKNAAGTSGLGSYNSVAAVSVNDSSSQAGAGDFKIECTRAYVFENESLDIRIVRTGGNGNAVDVTLYNDGTTQTISFAAGENYKTVTVNGQSHNGLRSSLDLHNDDTPPTPYDDYGLDYITIRDTSQELGGDPNGWISQKHDTEREFYFWYKGSVPFDYSLGDNNAVIKILTSKDVTLRHYGVSKIRNDATCDYTQENEKTCPVHQTCSFNSDFNHQPLDFYDDTQSGTMYLPDAEKHVFVDGCDTWHLFRGPALEYAEPYYTYRMNYRNDSYLVQTDQQNPGIYIIPEYTPPADTSTGPFETTCNGDTVTYYVKNQYSDMPSGLVYIGSTGFVEALSCGGYLSGEEISLYYANYTVEKPTYVSNLSATRTTECDDWSFLYGDASASYTDILNNTSPLTEVISRVQFDVFRQADWYDPASSILNGSNSDTTFEFVLVGWNIAGSVYRWNGTDYDMIGQERIYEGSFDSNSPELSQQLYKDRITEPFWFWKSNSYYYLKPNGGSDLTVEGPFATPVDNTVTPAVSVNYAGRKRIRLSTDIQGFTSEATDDMSGAYTNHLSIAEQYRGKNLYEIPWIDLYDSSVSVVMGSGAVTGSNLHWDKLVEVQEPYGLACGNLIEVSTYNIIMRDSPDYPIWGDLNWALCSSQATRFPNLDSPDCCFDNEWELANTPTDRNEAFSVPSSADSCSWYNCVPELNDYQEDFPYHVGPDSLNAQAYPILPQPTSETINITVGTGTGDICDCNTGQTSSGQVTQTYLDFRTETVWTGQLTRLSGGKTGAIIVSFDHTTIMPEIKKSGYHVNPFNADFNSLNKNGGLYPNTDSTNHYTNYTSSCWNDYNFPGLAFNESNLDSPLDPSFDPSDQYIAYSDYYGSRQERYVSGYNIPNPTLVDFADQDILDNSLCDYTPCVKQWKFDSVQQTFIDVHPRYLSMYVDKYTPTWPK